MVLGVSLFLGALVVVPAQSQSLAELARKEKERRAKLGKPAPAYREGKPKEGAADAKTAASSGEGVKPAAAVVDPDTQRAAWKQRADQAREAVDRETKALAVAEKEIETYRSDQAVLTAQEAQDPMRLPKREGRIRELQAKRDTQKILLENALKAVEALEQEARRSGIPAGWLR